LSRRVSSNRAGDSNQARARIEEPPEKVTIECHTDAKPCAWLGDDCHCEVSAIAATPRLPDANGPGTRASDPGFGGRGLRRPAPAQTDGAGRSPSQPAHLTDRAASGAADDSGSTPTAAFPGHLVFSHLRAFQNAGSFRFIPNLGPSGLAFAGIVAFWRNVRAARLCPVLRFVPPVGSFARDRNATERALDSISPPPATDRVAPRSLSALKSLAAREALPQLARDSAKYQKPLYTRAANSVRLPRIPPIHD